MSAYIVSFETISAIVRAFEIYGNESCTFKASDYVANRSWFVDLGAERQKIGQSLLNQNYRSVNYRYDENTPVPHFVFKDVEVNPGIILGCIQCYEYQACETDDYFESDLHNSLVSLKLNMLERMIKQAGYEIEWGYPYETPNEPSEPEQTTLF